MEKILGKGRVEVGGDCEVLRGIGWTSFLPFLTQPNGARKGVGCWWRLMQGAR